MQQRRAARPPRSLVVAAVAARDSPAGNLLDTRLVDAAINEPISFWGGIFAGFLALDLQQGERCVLLLPLDQLH